MAIYFLADVHLAENKPEITANFLNTINCLGNKNPQAVFILGDLFDYYLGDNFSNLYLDKIKLALKNLSLICPSFLIRGNRDFLIGEKFLQETGITLLSDRYIFELEEKIIILEHGDLLCTADENYQKLRKILRSKFLYKLSTLTPFWLNKFVGKFLRKNSQKAKTKKKMQNPKIVDVNLDELNKIIKTIKNTENKKIILIHGHTHQAKNIENNNYNRIVLGEWKPEGEVLEFNNGSFNLINSQTVRTEQ